MTAFARKMQARGHEVVFIGVPETEAAIWAANLSLYPSVNVSIRWDPSRKRWVG